MAGFHVLQGVEEVNLLISVAIFFWYDRAV